MVKRPERRLIAAVDIGSSKIAVLVAELTTSDEIKIIAMGFSPSQGLVKGQVVNFEEAQNAIRKAVLNAEVMLGHSIHDVIASCSGGHIESLNVQGETAIAGPTITVADVERAIQAAKKVTLQSGRTMMHVLPQVFVVDQTQNVKEPVGLVGKHLKAYVHVVTASSEAVHHNIKCIEKSGLKVSDLVLSPLASALGVLTNDEKELGVCLIDIGASTTDIAVFVQGALSFSASLPVGGDYVTHDIVHVLGTTTDCAENLKIQHGFALKNMADEKDLIEVKGVAGGAPQFLPATVLSEIIEARMEEIFTLVFNKLSERDLKSYIASAGIVLTGGGCKIPGSLELAADIFKTNARLGVPQYVVGINDSVYDPSHSTGVGLLMYAKLQQEVLPAHRSELLQWSWLKPVKEWFKRYF